MSEAAEHMRATSDLRIARRAAFGVNCPRCKIARPKAHPSILLPQQKCKVDGYRDEPACPTEAEEAVKLLPYGFVLTNTGGES
jgi:hypothetical protein